LKKSNIKTVVEKARRFKGRLRTIRVKHLLGEKNLIAEHKESGCRFRLDIEKCYFSSRLSNDRLEIAKKVKKGDKVLCMFSGVAVYPIIIAKHSKPGEIVAIELGRECNKYARENIRLNKVEDKIRLIQGDVKKKIRGLGKFDMIVMTRPNLKYSFLKEALKVAKKGTKIFYYGFSRQDDVKKMIGDLKKEAKGKIKILKTKKAGDIAPYKYRYRVEIRVL
jgi:tRNA (guanine37-N1)-methyltransferase